jgi:CubicO group peptidase (beta-lactamase class C family)
MLKTIWISLLAFALGVWGVNTLFRREVRTDELPSASEQTNGIAPNAPYTHLDTYLERQLAVLNVPGAALAIVEGEEIVHLRAFGRTGPNGQAPTPQTPFFIGSLTKSVTAVAILQLVEAGKVELDAPVQRYLPWFQVANPRATAQMTVRCLLNQTSGFTQTAGMIPLANFDDQPGAAERQARALATFQPARLPGAAWEYSNVNYNLLGLIIEAASGETYEAYVQNYIFMPLEMTHSHTAKAAAQQDGLAVGHRAWFGWPVAVPDLPVPAGSLPSGQLIASAEDMGHYLIAQLHNGRYQDTQLLSPASVTEMQRPAVTAASMGMEMGAYGMGWFVQQTDQGTRLWHNGQVPDYFAYMVLLPEQRRGLVLLTNTNQMALNFALLGVGEGAAALLAGAKPDSLPLGLISWLLRSFLLIPLLLMLDVLVTWRRVKGRQLANGRRPGVTQLWKWRILPPTLLYLTLALLAFILLLSNLRRFILLFMPDLAWLVLLCGGFALVWSLMRIRFLRSSF